MKPARVLSAIGDIALLLLVPFGLLAILFEVIR